MEIILGVILGFVTANTYILFNLKKSLNLVHKILDDKILDNDIANDYLDGVVNAYEEVSELLEMFSEKQISAAYLKLEKKREKEAKEIQF
jgi:hypothetical protein